ncbi:MAG TPA: IclR family transcriptional regulator C-terminal domain-containing protein [Acidobacteriaceae bacterium]|jgi:IclR family pca regulon transcriptional regulator
MEQQKRISERASTFNPRDNIANLIEEFEGDRDFVTSLARGLTIMQAFSQRARQLTVSQISAQVGVSRAAVRRSLLTLVKLGFAGTSDDQHYFLCPKVLSLGHAYFSSTPLARVSQPALENLSALLHESCSIATLDHYDVFYMARAAVSRIMSVDLKVGSRLPAFCTSMGRVLLADLPADRLEKYLKNVVLTQYTDKTVDSTVRLQRLLEITKRQGFTITDQELEIGLRSLAVPIRNRSGETVAALNVGCHAPRVNLREMQTVFLPHMQETARVIGAKL